MDYISQLAAQFEGFINVLGSIFGIVGFIFGAWRYFKERRAQENLKESRRELDEALSRLKHLEDYASGLKQYSAAV